MGAHEGRYRPWRYMGEAHGDTYMLGDAGELSSADRLLTCLKDRADAAFPLESTQVPESHPITYLRRGVGREV